MSLTQPEESPQSDGKMDISETTSLDSADASSTGINEMDRQELYFNILSPETNLHLNNHEDYKLQTHDILDDENDLNAINQSSLDNRFINNADLNLLSNTQERHTARTLTYHHPLMLSPICTDSNSELEHNNLGEDTKTHSQAKSINNYPDVVPKKDYRHIQVTAHKENPVKLLEDGVFTDLCAQDAKEQNVKIGKVLHDDSPDLLSSGSELNVSQYQAIVDANLQAVALTHKVLCHQDESGRASNKNLKNIRRVGTEDITSLDSISNHSFNGEDIEHNLASLSPSSSLIDGLDDDDEEDEGPDAVLDDEDNEELLGALTPTLTPTQIVSTNGHKNMLPQYTASEERKDSRNWQKITLPDGSTRDIDMRVIEPYKRVLSHGGYLNAGGHNAIVMFCACHLPDRSRTDYNYVMDNLFLYVVKTLDQLVTDDYVLIYLHGGSSRRNTPPFPWLKKCYQLLDRRLRKSLKNFYLVHPTFWIKSLIWMTRPFVSNKFWRKMVYVKSLEELCKHISPLEQAAIPDKVKEYDARKN